MFPPQVGTRVHHDIGLLTHAPIGSIRWIHLIRIYVVPAIWFIGSNQEPDQQVQLTALMWMGRSGLAVPTIFFL